MRNMACRIIEKEKGRRGILYSGVPMVGKMESLYLACEA